MVRVSSRLAPIPDKGLDHCLAHTRASITPGELCKQWPVHGFLGGQDRTVDPCLSLLPLSQLTLVTVGWMHEQLDISTWSQWELIQTAHALPRQCSFLSRGRPRFWVASSPLAPHAPLPHSALPCSCHTLNLPLFPRPLRSAPRVALTNWPPASTQIPEPILSEGPWFHSKSPMQRTSSWGRGCMFQATSGTDVEARPAGLRTRPCSGSRVQRDGRRHIP